MKRLITLTALLAAVLGMGGTTAALAAPPTLTEPPGAALKGVYRAGQSYTLTLVFKDPDGDRPRRVKFIDQSDAGNVEVDGRIGPGDPQTGVNIDWNVRGFAPGGHRAYFAVTGTDGNTARYPPDPNEFYTFAAENLVTKWVIMGAGLLVGLLFLPFLVYVLARSMNRRGDPSRAARVGLLLGILACCALFIYLFASTYGPLTYVMGGIAALALLVIVLTRR